MPAAVTKPILLDETGQVMATYLNAIRQAIEDQHAPSWNEVTNKPFSTIGTGLSIENDILNVTIEGAELDDEHISERKTYSNYKVEKLLSLSEPVNVTFSKDINNKSVITEVYHNGFIKITTQPPAELKTIVESLYDSNNVLLEQKRIVFSADGTSITETYVEV